MRKLFDEYGQSLLTLLCGVNILNLFLNAMFKVDGTSLRTMLVNWLTGLI